MLTSRHDALDVSEVLRKAYVCFETTPDALRPPVTTFSPMPRGATYPEFKTYPVRAVLSHQNEREIIAQAEAGVVLRRRQLEEVKARHSQ